MLSIFASISARPASWSPELLLTCFVVNGKHKHGTYIERT